MRSRVKTYSHCEPMIREINSLQHLNNNGAIGIQKIINVETLSVTLEDYDHTLYDFVNIVNDETSKQLFPIIYQKCIDIVSDIHKYGIIHRDLNNKNIVVKWKTISYTDHDLEKFIKTVDVMIINFENSTCIPIRENFIVGDKMYTSPESYFTDGVFTQSIDIWALAVTFLDYICKNNFSVLLDCQDFYRPFLWKKFYKELDEIDDEEYFINGIICCRYSCVPDINIEWPNDNIKNTTHKMLNLNPYLRPFVKIHIPAHPIRFFKSNYVKNHLKYTINRILFLSNEYGFDDTMRSVALSILFRLLPNKNINDKRHSYIKNICDITNTILYLSIITVDRSACADFLDVPKKLIIDMCVLLKWKLRTPSCLSIEMCKYIRTYDEIITSIRNEKIGTYPICIITDILPTRKNKSNLFKKSQLTFN